MEAVLTILAWSFVISFAGAFFVMWNPKNYGFYIQGRNHIIPIKLHGVVWSGYYPFYLRRRLNGKLYLMKNPMGYLWYWKVEYQDGSPGQYAWPFLRYGPVRFSYIKHDPRLLLDL